MNYKEATLFSWAVMILIFALTSTTTTTIIKNLFLPPLLRPLNATGTFYAYIFFIRIPQRFSNFFFTCKINDCITKNSIFNPHITFVANLRLELNISIIIFQITLSSSDSSSKWNISFSWVLTYLVTNHYQFATYFFFRVYWSLFLCAPYQ